MHEDADRDQPTDPGDRRAAWRDEARSLHEEARALRGELSAISGSLLRLEACIKSHLEENAKVLPVLEDLVALRRGSQIVMPILVKIVAACATVACSLWAAAYWMCPTARTIGESLSMSATRPCTSPPATPPLAFSIDHQPT